MRFGVALAHAEMYYKTDSSARAHSQVASLMGSSRGFLCKGLHGFTSGEATVGPNCFHTDLCTHPGIIAAAGTSTVAAER